MLMMLKTLETLGNLMRIYPQKWCHMVWTINNLLGFEEFWIIGTAGFTMKHGISMVGMTGNDPMAELVRWIVLVQPVYDMCFVSVHHYSSLVVIVILMRFIIDIRMLSTITVKNEHSTTITIWLWIRTYQHSSTALFAIIVLIWSLLYQTIHYWNYGFYSTGCVHWCEPTVNNHCLIFKHGPLPSLLPRLHLNNHC